MNGTTKPIVRCMAAITYGEGHVWGEIHHVSLEVANELRQTGYSIIGPDPEDLQALAQWERQQIAKWPWQA